jgi:hypothetical protein
MEPYSPEFRRELKEAHPGLRDEDIDRLEELTTRRAQMQTERDSNIILNLDHQINELLRNKIPNFDKVVRQHAAKLHGESASRTRPPVEVKPKQ